MVSSNLSRKQFDVLTFLEQTCGPVTQREIAEKTGMSLGSVNRATASLQELGFLEGSAITPLGLAALEPYRVKRAVFIAAGFGSRLVPITLNTPKPLVRVNGKRMIDTLLDAVVAAGIQEIYVVRGYLGEQFDQLRYKYPMIQFVENPLYNEANNISSAMCVRHLLQNAYVNQDTSGLQGKLGDLASRSGISESLFLAMLAKLDVPKNQMDKDMASLSAGQKKKVLLARSICQPAHLHVWDEPMNYIDVISRMQIEELLREYAPTILFVEHDRTFCENIATKIVML